MNPAHHKIRGKFSRQPFVFYYWEYSKEDKALKKHSVSFNSDGRSIRVILKDHFRIEQMEAVLVG